MWLSLDIIRWHAARIPNGNVYVRQNTEQNKHISGTSIVFVNVKPYLLDKWVFWYAKQPGEKLSQNWNSFRIQSTLALRIFLFVFSCIENMKVMRNFPFFSQPSEWSIYQQNKKMRKKILATFRRHLKKHPHEMD